MNAIVVAKGEKSRRLNQDKALVKIAGRTLVEILLEKIAGIFDKIYLVTRQPAKFKFLESKNEIAAPDCARNDKPKKLELVKDNLKCGPLGGIFLGLQASDSFYNFVISADLLFLDRRLLSYLMKKEKNYQALIPGGREFLQPLCGIYAQSVRPALERMLAEKKYKLREIFPEIETAYVSGKELKRFGDPEVLFFNLNTVKDLEKARRMWRKFS
ncbi:MAG: molybdenum cofactor guanylyltransferase [Candidatus Omnitrophota bacterium]|nr:molybdenum cofactor guanylyltransferase [Candidatus Omnitrophota bacterium]